MIRRVKGGYRVVARTGRNMGTYPTYEKAERRLEQIEMFKSMAKPGGRRSARSASLSQIERDVLLDTLRAPIKRKLYGLVIERTQAELAQKGMLKWHHVHAGQSSFSDHYVVTDAGKRALRPPQFSPGPVKRIVRSIKRFFRRG